VAPGRVSSQLFIPSGTPCSQIFVLFLYAATVHGHASMRSFLRGFAVVLEKEENRGRTELLGRLDDEFI
jgi:hypothetical protein